MKISDLHLGFVGFGHMAQVICRSIVNSKLIPRSQLLFIRRDRDKSKQNEQDFGITATSLKTLVDKSDLILLCVRPSQAEFTFKELALIGLGSKKVVSVMSGIKHTVYRKYLGPSIELLRAMPNIASAVGEGVTSLSYGSNSSNEFKSTTQLLFSSMGRVLEISEELMDIATAVGGSGPGFVFRLIESMARAGEKGGLLYSQSLEMAAAAFAGAARLILDGANPETLIQQIAPLHGTTEAGFRKMSELHVDKHLQEVIEACAARSKELSKEF